MRKKEEGSRLKVDLRVVMATIWNRLVPVCDYGEPEPQVTDK